MQEDGFTPIFGIETHFRVDLGINHGIHRIEPSFSLFACAPTRQQGPKAAQTRGQEGSEKERERRRDTGRKGHFMEQ